MAHSFANSSLVRCTLLPKKKRNLGRSTIGTNKHKLKSKFATWLWLIFPAETALVSYVYMSVIIETYRILYYVRESNSKLLTSSIWAVHSNWTVSTVPSIFGSFFFCAHKLQFLKRLYKSLGICSQWHFESIELYILLWLRWSTKSG